MIRVVHSGFRIRILAFYPSRIPDRGVKKAPDPGSGMNNPDHETIFFRLKYWNSLMRVMRIRDPDPGWKKIGSRIRDGKKLVNTERDKSWRCLDQRKKLQYSVVHSTWVASFSDFFINLRRYTVIWKTITLIFLNNGNVVLGPTGWSPQRDLSNDRYQFQPSSLLIGQ